ncbi:hypothetical protein HGE1_02197 [Anaplasma phagocytophilum str. HGE1]|uniref:Uncharacterized protein n=2 Tax=Anaplasma phagocytophilum TaxID=948 RepID=Q2GKM5_ANAPZ|nr:hypothetical protein APH_0476 [Anaplasma phagocytophilum str. HZ]AGR79336.1 hypothetical protein YYU_02330 [Anaplasma phagocytophilum str. HZ2]AGR80582.1 hypothetical protein WSQ_02325 [Anaplasma phagocytophilum str. JM]AGR81843.1 hypothetical protein YYY_02360 [Anaplasma phagocytophilum str. Dog2]EOA60835.1 hypothetical protein HGE1_02197 [Anaplasma phagocytophilum str. HGE1]EOA62034.1 hypothetical protein CRT38_02162 [Anaplasma phagocytophilum str. CRT38]
MPSFLAGIMACYLGLANVVRGEGGNALHVSKIALR